MAIVARIFLLCAALLILPDIAAAQPAPLTVQRVWVQDTGGTSKTIFAPGEAIQFVAELNNPYGGYLLGANGTRLTITTSFYNNTKPVDIPPGISAWPWNAVAPSNLGDYTVTVQAYDHFYGAWREGEANFTIQPRVQPPPVHSSLSPGWYHNGAGTTSGISPILYQNRSGLRIIWQNSYIYKNPGEANLYWYAEVIYFNTGKKTLNITCKTLLNTSVIREHIHGSAGFGLVSADETFCSRNPRFTVSLKPGKAQRGWAIFHNVPQKESRISLEWGPYGRSPSVNPWYFAYPSNTPPPQVCPPELVTLGTCKPPKASKKAGPPHYVCAGEPCGDPRKGTKPSGPTKEQVTNATLCAIDLLPGGTTLKLVTSVGGSFIAVADDAYTGRVSYITFLKFVPLGSCFELIGSWTPIEEVG